MVYDELLTECDSAGITVKEKPLKYHDGRQKGNRIAIRKDIKTTTEKGCVLAEELGHYYTSVGDILDQSSAANRKQEYHARLWSYNRLVGLYGIVSCYKAGCHNLHDMAEHLGVSEEFMAEALESYRRKYGNRVRIDNYIIYFEPNLGVFEAI